MDSRCNRDGRSDRSVRDLMPVSRAQLLNDHARRLVREGVRRGLGHIVDRQLADKVRHALFLSQGGRRLMLQTLVRILRHTSIEGQPPFALPDNRRILLASTDSSLTQLLYWYGEASYESELLCWWRWLVREATSVLELGSNIGIYSIAGRQVNPQCRYRSVDAHPDACSLLATNLKLNGFTDVDVVNAAVVGDDRTTVKLAIPVREAPRAPSTAHLLGGDLSASIRTTVDVPAVRARSLLEDADLVKLDIEGSETGVLRDLLPGLVVNRAILVIEVLPGLAGLVDTLELMTSTTHRAYVPEHGRLRPLPSIPRQPKAWRDLVLVPRSRSIPWIGHFAF